MKKRNLFNKVVTAVAFSGIFIAGFPKIAFSSPTVSNVCKKDNTSDSKAYVFVSNNGQDIVVETNLDHDGVSRGAARNTLKNSHGFSDSDAQSVFVSLNDFTLSDINPCQPLASTETVTETEVVTPTPPATLTLTGTIRDFKEDHPDFESTTGNDRGLVTTELGLDKKPIYAHGDNTTRTTNGQTYFNQWYRDVDGVNLSKQHSIDLALQPDGTYKYQNNSFFPINGELWGNYRNNKNYHFTYELHTKFTYRGGETFTFSGDDDVFVYIDGKRVIDIGGVHTSQTDSVNLDSLGLTVGETYDLDFFFAERHYSQSNFTITTSIELETAANPDADDDNDGITNILEDFENETDSDGDGTPDYMDEDSDDNGIPDSDEVGVASDPSDSDSDNIPNFQDTDDDGNGIDDVDEIGSDSNNPTNTDGEDLPDFQDTDDDNDGINDVDEIGSDSSNPTDTDGDNTPDYHDEDSDDDGINDAVESNVDTDGDGTSDFQDYDSDNPDAATSEDVDNADYVGIPDSEEGENNSDNDGVPNFQDSDNDDDGIPDDDELIGDADGDGEPDTPDNLPDDDVDDDDIPNSEDPDSDGDDIPDKIEKATDGLEPYIENYAD